MSGITGPTLSSQRTYHFKSGHVEWSSSGAGAIADVFGAGKIIINADGTHTANVNKIPKVTATSGFGNSAKETDSPVAGQQEDDKFVDGSTRETITITMQAKNTDPLYKALRDSKSGAKGTIAILESDGTDYTITAANVLFGSSSMQFEVGDYSMCEVTFSRQEAWKFFDKA